MAIFLFFEQKSFPAVNPYSHILGNQSLKVISGINSGLLPLVVKPISSKYSSTLLQRILVYSVPFTICVVVNPSPALHFSIFDTLHCKSRYIPCSTAEAYVNQILRIPDRVLPYYNVLATLTGMVLYLISISNNIAASLLSFSRISA